MLVLCQEEILQCSGCSAHKSRGLGSKNDKKANYAFKCIVPKTRQGPKDKILLIGVELLFVVSNTNKRDSPYRACNEEF